MREAALAAARAAEHAVAADRFAREIVAFLMSCCAARLRQLNAKPFGTRGSVIVIPFFDGTVANRAS